MTALTLVPWLLGQVFGVWTLSLSELPQITLATGLPNVALWIWLLVAGLLLIHFITVVIREQRSVMSLPAIEDAEVVELVATLANRLQIPAPLLKQGELACSLTLPQATLVLPLQWREWDESTLQAVLAHELVHISRRDDRWLLIMRCLCLAYWWMPWLRLMARSHEEAMEESCDDAASELIGAPATYVQALVAAVVPPALSGQYAPAMHAHHLVSRVRRFADARIVELDTPRVFWCVIAILTVVSFVTSVEPVLAKPRTAEIYLNVSPSLSIPPETTRNSTYPTVRDELRLPASLMANERQRFGQPRNKSLAIYPGSAINGGIEGHVIVEFTVNRDGSTALPRIISTEPPSTFEAAALRAVRATQYLPSYGGDALSAPLAPSRPLPRVQRVFEFELLTR